jgi:hypothetical protein
MVKLFVLLFFDVVGAGVIISYFGMTLYTLVGCLFIIIVCSVLANVTGAGEDGGGE